MRKLITAAMVAVALAAVPAMAAAQAPTAKSSTKPAAEKSKSPSVASHSTNGVVKSMDASSLVITKPGKKPEDMTFTVTPSTQKQGTPDVGSTVTVRYKTEGTTNTATAIVAKPAKPTAKK